MRESDEKGTQASTKMEDCKTRHGERQYSSTILDAIFVSVQEALLVISLVWAYR
jgi:hypothetical protein